MLPLFPFLAYLRDKNEISLRAAARELGVSHPYLSGLEEFTTSPPDGTESKDKSSLRMLVMKQLENLDPKAEGLYQANLDIDRLFLQSRRIWLNLFINLRYYGPLFGLFRLLYITESSCDSRNHVDLSLPAASSAEIITLRYLSERLYSPALMRQRFPKIKLRLPMYARPFHASDICFDFETRPDVRGLFYWHPLGESYACFLLYIYLKSFTISSLRTPLETQCAPEEDTDIFKDYSVYNGYRINCRPSESFEPHAQVVLYPPQYYSERIDGKLEKRAIPEGIAGIKVCMSSFASPIKLCWCCAHSSL